MNNKVNAGDSSQPLAIKVQTPAEICGTYLVQDVIKFSLKPSFVYPLNATFHYAISGCRSHKDVSNDYSENTVCLQAIIYLQTNNAVCGFPLLECP